MSLQDWLCWYKHMQINSSTDTLLLCALVYLTKFKHEGVTGAVSKHKKMFCNSQLSYNFFISLLVANNVSNTYCIRMLHVVVTIFWFTIVTVNLSFLLTDRCFMFALTWFATMTVNCSKFKLIQWLLCFSVQPSVKYVSGPLRVSQCSCST